MRVESLGFFRFFAAIIIVIAHCRFLSFADNLSFLDWPIFSKFSGYQMVAFFFVLSGYVNYLAYGTRGPLSIKRFTISRIARIFPLYYFAFFLMAGFLSLVGKPPSLTQWLLHSTFMHAWIPAYAQSVTFVTWTISVDIFLYLLFPFIVFWMHKKSTTINKVFWATTCLYLMTLFFASYCLNLDAIELGVSKKNLSRFIYLFPLFHLSSFMIGIYAAYWVDKYPDKLKFFSSNTLLILFFITISLLIHYYQEISDLIGFKLINHITYAPLFGIMMLIMSANRSAFVRLLERPIFIYLGSLSYGVYIFQVVIFFFYQNTLQRLWPHVPDYMHVFSGIILVILFSMLTLRYIESPANDYLRKKLPQWLN